MPQHVSFLQLMGVAVLVLAGTLWTVGLVRILRRHRPGTTARRRRATLRALPHQRVAGPHLESVELTPAERAAFAGLVRQFSDGRF
jgi:hypothetical protein